MNGLLLRASLDRSPMMFFLRVSLVYLLQRFCGSVFLDAAELVNGVAAIAVVTEGKGVACHQALETWVPFLQPFSASDLSGVG
jgi:hypothetical protein